uniref:Uncharacterized protein n=1 Tax=Nymphaea colorata TaxID=210225 RepID=A0A5K1C9Z6_9MAGN
MAKALGRAAGEYSVPGSTPVQTQKRGTGPARMGSINF